jgi:hypothetical protein
MIPSASGLIPLNFAVPPSALNLFDNVRWKGVSVMSAAGTQTRVIPAEFSTSTRVVTSKVRQPLGATAFANKDRGFEIARPADAAAADRRKSRRFMKLLSFEKFLCQGAI